MTEAVSVASGPLRLVLLPKQFDAAAVGSILRAVTRYTGNLMNLHPQLHVDCHHLGSMPSGALLLMRNSSLPWFILVPTTNLADVLDLDATQREQVLSDCAAISAFIKQVLGYNKVNFAGLGNVVPQMHLHIIGRAADDPCWPQPVWGRLAEAEDYTPEHIVRWRQALSQHCEFSYE